MSVHEKEGKKNTGEERNANREIKKRVELFTYLFRGSTYRRWRKKLGIFEKPVEPVVDFYDGKQIHESESEKKQCY